MRSNNRPAQLLTCLLIATALTLAGSATFANGQATTATLQSAEDDYYQAEFQTEAIEEAMNELTISPAEDLQQAYDYFTEKVDAMQQTAQRLIDHADGMHFKGASYFVDSGKTATACPYPGFAPPPDQRAAELGEYFNAISEEGWEAKHALRAYQFDMEQIRSHLATHLTPAGIDTIAQIFRKAQVDTESLMYALEQTRAAIEEAKNAKAQPQPPPAGG